LQLRLRLRLRLQKGLRNCWLPHRNGRHAKGLVSSLGLLRLRLRLRLLLLLQEVS
jgi:hypothetical protein